MAPVIVAGMGLLFARTGVTSDWVRFHVSRFYYLHKIAEAPRANNAPLFIMFDWGESGGAAVPNIFDTLIYDETDQIGLPPEKRSDEWMERMDKRRTGSILYTILEPGKLWETTAFGQHFFLVRVIF